MGSFVACWKAAVLARRWMSWWHCVCLVALCDNSTLFKQLKLQFGSGQCIFGLHRVIGQPIAIARDLESIPTSSRKGKPTPRVWRFTTTRCQWAESRQYHSMCNWAKGRDTYLEQLSFGLFWGTAQEVVPHQQWSSSACISEVITRYHTQHDKFTSNFPTLKEKQSLKSNISDMMIVAPLVLS